MNLNLFLAESLRLSKPCQLLKFNGTGEIIGYWLGEKGESGYISVYYLSEWITVFINNDGISGEIKKSDYPLLNINHARPLYAESSICLPPIDAIFLYGNSDIQAFLKENNWSSDIPYNDNFPNNIPAEYEKTWQKTHPFYQESIVAILNGWNMVWADDDNYQQYGEQLLCTLYNAEPWVEVCNKNQQYNVILRVS